MPVPKPNCSIGDLEYRKKAKVCEGLDECGKWRDLAKVVTEKIFQLKSTEIEKIAQAFHRPPGCANSPSEELWDHFKTRGMKVYQLVSYLDQLKLEKELMELKEPEPLHITKDPVSEIVVERKKPFKLSCQAIGFPYPRYTWFKSKPGSTEMEEVGDNQTLEFNKIKKCHEGYYICQIYNALTLKAKKKGKEFDHLILRTSGTNILVKGEGPDSDPDDEEHKKFIVRTGYVPNTRNGGVVCDDRTHSSKPFLRITKQPSDTEVKEMSKICLECEAEGDPVIEYQWYFNDSKIKECGNERCFKISSCFIRHSGTYYCSIYNGNELQTKRVTLRVKEAQMNTEFQIIREPSSQYLAPDTTLQVIVRTIETNISCIWFHVTSLQGQATVKTVPVSSNTDSRSIISKLTQCGSFVSTLKFQYPTIEHEGRYYCEISVKTSENKTITKRTKDVNLKFRPMSRNPVDKIALFIGGEHFKSLGVNLDAAPYDVRTTANYFEQMGFKVISLMDLTLTEMDKAVDLLCDFIGPGVYVTLYFVSHGFHYKGNHYLQPWDATQGPDLDDLLCLEKVLFRVQKHRPLFVLMIVDMCRINGEEKIQGPKDVKADLKPAVHGNSLIIYAASKYQSAYERRHVPGLPKEQKKGVFCQYFCDVLEKHSDKPVMEIFRIFRKEFENYRLYDVGQQYEMDPEMIVNLVDQERKLTDPIDRPEDDSQDWIEREKRLKKYEYINRLPRTPVTWTTSDKPETNFSITYEKLFSNSFVLIVQVIKIGLANNLNFEFLPKDSNVTIQAETDNNNIWRFVIKDIQRLKSDFSPELRMRYNVHGQTKSSSINLFHTEDTSCLRRPLISSNAFWNSSGYQKSQAKTNQPQEDEEPTSSIEYCDK